MGGYCIIFGRGTIRYDPQRQSLLRNGKERREMKGKQKLDKGENNLSNIIDYKKRRKKENAPRVVTPKAHTSDFSLYRPRCRAAGASHQIGLGPSCGHSPLNRNPTLSPKSSSRPWYRRQTREPSVRPNPGESAPPILARASIPLQICGSMAS